MRSGQDKEMKKKTIITLIIFFLAASLAFFGYYIGRNEIRKAAIAREQNPASDFNPADINVDLIKDDIEFAASIPEIKMKFTGMLENELEITFLDIVTRFKDKTIDFSATGERSDGEIISVNYTGIRLNEILASLKIQDNSQNLVVFASDFYSVVFSNNEIRNDNIYLVWKKDGQYLNPSEDGFLKIVIDGGKTSRWIKNPLLFDFVGEFDYTLPLSENLVSESVITYITEEELFRLQISSTPRINTETWVLKFSGLVENEFFITYDDIIKMPQKTVYATLETISNPIGGPMIGSAFWTGVPFSYLLEKAGLREGALEVVFYCADKYSTSITVEEAMKEDVILAYKINGELLPDYHGYPVRMVLPDKYGMKWAKWINEIEIVDYDYKGFWEEQGWSDYAGRDRPDQRFD